MDCSTKVGSRKSLEDDPDDVSSESCGAGDTDLSIFVDERLGRSDAEAGGCEDVGFRVRLVLCYIVSGDYRFEEAG